MISETLALPKEQVSAEPGEAASGSTESWDSWCEWLDRTVAGIATSMERVEHDGTRMVEFRNFPLVEIRAHRLENGVKAISMTFAVNNHERRFEITGVKAIQLERDGAGFPTVVEFVSESERVVLRFTGGAQTAPIYSGNSWGE
jgi:hypothetical protein